MKKQQAEQCHFHGTNSPLAPFLWHYLGFHARKMAFHKKEPPDEAKMARKGHDLGLIQPKYGWQTDPESGCANIMAQIRR